MPVNTTDQGDRNMTTPDIESEIRAAVEAYETISGHPATRTWPMIQRYGPIGALSRLVQSGDAQKGFTDLVAAGHSDLTFEAIVLRHPDSFTRSVVEAARWRLEMAASGKL